MWIVVHPETGARLCKDNKWRSFAMFGTPRWCVKTYKRLGNAQNAADRVRVNGKTHIIHIRDGETVDASGRIWKTVDCGNGMEKTIEVTPSAYKRSLI
jgi:hypothetical protein